MSEPPSRNDQSLPRGAGRRQPVGRRAGLADPHPRPVLPEIVVARLPLWPVTRRSLRHLPRVRATLGHLADGLGRHAMG